MKRKTERRSSGERNDAEKKTAQGRSGRSMSQRTDLKNRDANSKNENDRNRDQQNKDRRAGDHRKGRDLQTEDRRRGRREPLEEAARETSGGGSDRGFETGENSSLIIGRNPVAEALKSGRSIEKLFMQKDAEGSARLIAKEARERKITVQYLDKQAMDRISGNGSHQGVAAAVAAYDYCEVDDILAAAEAAGEDPFIVLLDSLEDPHNLGAIMRTADAAGAHGIVIPSRRSVSLTETVAKASAGAIEYVPVAKVGNLVQTIDELKRKGLWIAACDMGGDAYYDSDITGPVAIVIGGEGHGVGRLVREKCDYIVSIPMKGKISSLNASNAAAILLYEVYRQRLSKEKTR